MSEHHVQYTLFFPVIFPFLPCFSSTRQNRGATSSPRCTVEPGRLKCHQAPLAFLLPAAYDGHHEKRRHPGPVFRLRGPPSGGPPEAVRTGRHHGPGSSAGGRRTSRLMADSGNDDMLYSVGAARLRKNHAGAHSGDAHVHAFRSSLRRLLRHGGFEKSL